MHENADCQTAATKAGLIESLVATLKCHANSQAEELLATAIVALASVCHANSDGALRLCAAGGPDAVVSCMGNFSGDGIVQERGCEFIAILASGGCGESILDVGGLETVIQCMLLCSKNSDVQTAGCDAISSIIQSISSSSSVVEARVVASGAPAALLQCLQLHWKNSELLRVAAKTLTALSSRWRELQLQAQTSHRADYPVPAWAKP